MSSEPDLNAILDDLAAGRIDAAEASLRIQAARAAAEATDARGDGWRAFAREDTGRGSDEASAAESAAPESAAEPPSAQATPEQPREPAPQESAQPRQAPQPPPAAPGAAPRAASARPQEPTFAGASGQGAERVSVRSVGRRVRVVGDWSVPSVAVTGPHVLRRTGRVIEVTAEGQPVPLEGFSLLKLPRSLDDLKNLGLGAELVVQVNPRLVVDAEVTGSGLVVEGMPSLGRIRVSAGSATLRGVRQASDVLVQMGSALVEGPLAEGRSRVKCESGALTVNLTEGANVTVRAAASMGRVSWPSEGLGAIDEWVVGNGSGRLDVEIVMGMASIKDAVEAGHVGPADPAQSALCPSCGADTGGGRFCPQCGTAQSAACAACGTELPAHARFCTACGTPA